MVDDPIFTKSFSLFETRDYKELAKDYKLLDSSYEQLFIKILIFGSAGSIIAIATIFMNPHFEALADLSVRIIIFSFVVAMIFAGLVPFVASNYYENKTSEAYSLSSKQNYERALDEVMKLKACGEDPLAELLGHEVYCRNQVDNYASLARSNEDLASKAKTAIKFYLLLAMLAFGFGVMLSLNLLFGLI